MSKIKSKQINDFATEVRNQISAGTGISISNGEVSSTITQYTDALADARIAAKRNAANGICGLNANTLIDSQYLPALAITNVNIVANQAARLALTAQEGDVAIQTDDSSSWIYDGTSWIQFNTNVVSSVNTKTGVITLTTSDISEGTNQYFTNTRFDNRLAAKTSDSLAEGSTNLYYTSTRVNSAFDTRLATKTTDNLTEGSTNQYFTTARARASFSAGSNITITNGVIASTASGGGGNVTWLSDVTANNTVLSLTDSNSLALVKNTTNAWTVYLPTISGKNGKVIRIKRLGTGIVTIAVNSSDTGKFIDVSGTTSILMGAQYSTFDLVANEADGAWYLI